jgi:outer membrane receptor protein involved in Fe transport
MWQDDSGYLDGSIRYQVNDGLEVSLDVTNILDTTAVMQQQIFGDSPGSPGAKPVKIDSGWTRNDRRFQFGVRFRY